MAAADETAQADVPRRARGAPCLWFTRLPLRELADLIRERHWPRVPGAVRVQFAEQERLVEADADPRGGPPLLSYHAVLNHAQTPAEVFGALAKRSLYGVAAALRGDRALPLPLAALCPEESYADAWLARFLGACLYSPTAHEEPEVRRGWQRQWLEARPAHPGLELRRRESEAALLALDRRGRR